MGPFFYFALVPSKADEAVPFIAEAARRHELVCFDPQQEKLLQGSVAPERRTTLGR